VLRELKLNPADPKTQALLLVCNRYDLDPVLKHVVLVDGNVYITRDGLLHVAHASGKLDGIEVLSQGADSTHFTAVVAVYRKDMSRPFTYPGRYARDSRQAKKGYGPEMALKCAESMALRRAFDVGGIATVEEQETIADVVYHDARIPEVSGPIAVVASASAEPVWPVDYADDTPLDVSEAHTKNTLVMLLEGDKARARAIWAAHCADAVPTTLGQLRQAIVKADATETRDAAQAAASGPARVLDWQVLQSMMNEVYARPGAAAEWLEDRLYRKHGRRIAWEDYMAGEEGDVDAYWMEATMLELREKFPPEEPDEGPEGWEDEDGSPY
jgi:hypothetical protein